MHFENKTHLKEELLAVSTRKTLKTFVLNVNEELDENLQIDHQGSIQEILRGLMLAPMEVLERNFHETFEDEYISDTSDDEEDESEEDEEEE